MSKEVYTTSSTEEFLSVTVCLKAFSVFSLLSTPNLPASRFFLNDKKSPIVLDGKGQI